MLNKSFPGDNVIGELIWTMIRLSATLGDLSSAAKVRDQSVFRPCGVPFVNRESFVHRVWKKEFPP
jgi:hypothetical protein